MKLKSAKLISLALASLIGFSAVNILPTFAANNVCDMQPGVDIAQEVYDAAGCNNNSDALPPIIISILNAVITVAGLVAVIFVIVGGFNYMTSAGDPGKTKKAKDTILYAVIGLIICVLAFAIVNFVINDIINSSSKSTESDSTPDSTSLVHDSSEFPIALLNKTL